MLLIVILNAVLAVTILTVIVTLHARAIHADRQEHGGLFTAQRRVRAAHRATRAPDYRPAHRAPRATRRSVAA
jgi:hypothetical protein